MRIAFVAFHGSVHTRRWVAFFADRGHDVHVVTCGGGRERDLDADGRPIAASYGIHDLGKPRFGKLGYLLKLWKARRVVRALNPDVVHAHYVTSYGLLALATGVQPLVVTAHGDDVLISPRNPVMRHIVTRVLNAAEVVTVPSDHMRDAVHELTAPNPAPVAVFQYGVETTHLALRGDELRAGDESRDMPGRPLRIVSARALLQLYRIDVVLDALARLRDRGVRFSCDIVGDGPERETLEQRSRALGLAGRVKFHGHQPPVLVEQIIARSDVYVSVAESDGVSIALLEALALGAVPVLSDIDANRSWISDGQSGVLVPIESGALADGIECAGRIDRAAAAQANLRTVFQRADRDANLGACELLLDSLVGVVYEPAPDMTPAADSDAA